MTTNTAITTTNEQNETTGGPPARVPLPGDGPAMREGATALVEQARDRGVELTGDNGLLTDLVRHLLQTGLEIELTDHLGYEPRAVEGRGSGNSRSGSHPKTVATEVGQVELQVPRDRSGPFEPVTVPKGQRRLDGLSGNVTRGASAQRTLRVWSLTLPASRAGSSGWARSTRPISGNNRSFDDDADFVCDAWFFIGGPPCLSVGVRTPSVPHGTNEAENRH